MPGKREPSWFSSSPNRGGARGTQGRGDAEEGWTTPCARGGTRPLGDRVPGICTGIWGSGQGIIIGPRKGPWIQGVRRGAGGRKRKGRNPRRWEEESGRRIDSGVCGFQAPASKALYRTGPGFHREAPWGGVLEGTLLRGEEESRRLPNSLYVSKELKAEAGGSELRSLAVLPASLPWIASPVPACPISFVKGPRPDVPKVIAGQGFSRHSLFRPRNRPGGSPGSVIGSGHLRTPVARKRTSALCSAEGGLRERPGEGPDSCEIVPAPRRDPARARERVLPRDGRSVARARVRSFDLPGAPPARACVLSINSASGSATMAAIRDAASDREAASMEEDPRWLLLARRR